MKTAKQIIDWIVEECNLNESEIARRVDSTQPTIWRVRNGQVQQCGEYLYRDLAKLEKKLKLKRKSNAL